MAVCTEQKLQDPQARLDWVMDWSKWLAEGETIVNWDVKATENITVDDKSLDGAKITAWLMGGENGTTARVTYHIETNAGRIDERTIEIKIFQR